MINFYSRDEKIELAYGTLVLRFHELVHDGQCWNQEEDHDFVIEFPPHTKRSMIYDAASNFIADCTDDGEGYIFEVIDDGESTTLVRVNSDTWWR